MKKTHILILFVVVLAVSGCDFFRKLAGRPTSEDIQVKKEQIACVEAEKAEAAREQARLDSLEAEKERLRVAMEMAERDSLNAYQTLKDKGCMMYDLSSLKGLSAGELSYRYYLVVGSFKDAANADKFMEKVSNESDLNPVKIRFRNGMVAVGVCPCNRVVEVASFIDDVRAKSFCPKDAWILVNGQ